MGFGFWFERFDSLAIWQLDRIFDLSQAQEGHLRPIAEDVREWFRAESFPELASELRSIKESWDQGAHEQALYKLEETTNKGVEQFLEYSWPGARQFLDSLTRENIEAYQQYANEEFGEWYQDIESQSAKLESRLERLEDWFGTISVSQKMIVGRYVKLYPEERKIRLNNAHARGQQFLQLAISKDWQKLEHVYKNPQSLQSEVYLTWRAYEREQTHKMLKALFPTLTEYQKQHVSDRLEKWAGYLLSVGK